MLMSANFTIVWYFSKAGVVTRPSKSCHSGANGNFFFLESAKMRPLYRNILFPDFLAWRLSGVSSDSIFERSITNSSAVHTEILSTDVSKQMGHHFLNLP